MGIAVTPTEKHAIRAIAAIQDSDESTLLRTMLIDDIVTEFDRVRSLRESA